VQTNHHRHGIGSRAASFFDIIYCTCHYILILQTANRGKRISLAPALTLNMEVPMSQAKNIDSTTPSGTPAGSAASNPSKPDGDLFGVIVDMEDDLHKAIRMVAACEVMVELDNLDAFYATNDALRESLITTKGLWLRAFDLAKGLGKNAVRVRARRPYFRTLPGYPGEKQCSKR
jgi:hypothetical protein